MSKKSKIICIILVIIFIASIITTGIIGLNVGVEYLGGTSITIDLKKEYESKDIKNIVKEVWKNESVLVQKVEVYNESVSIKVSNASDEQLEELINKVNEKYELELTKNDLIIFYNSNVKLRDIVLPYIIPMIITTGLIVVYYSIRFRGIKEILELLLKLVGLEGMIYSIYALIRIPINHLTMPIAIIAYIAVVIWVTLKSENSEKDK